jgi:hypothetical protein
MPWPGLGVPLDLLLSLLGGGYADRGDPGRYAETAPWSANITEGRIDAAAEDAQVHDTITAATNGPSGKRKRPRAAQEAS